MKVFLNGKLVPEEEAVVSIFDRGFLYGDGLFETIRIHNGKPFRWTQHLARLRRGAEFLRLKVPISCSELLLRAVELVAANQLSDALLRITLSRGVGIRGYSPKGAGQPTLVMATHRAPALSEEALQRWRLVISSMRVPAGEPLAAFKTCNKLPQILARAEAESRGADEALLLNTKGELAEAASSNLFWIEGEAICTTPLTSGILAGIMRELIFELGASMRIHVQEKAAQPDTLRGASGVFLTLSSLGIVEATELEGRSLATSTLVEHIFASYRQTVMEETA